MCNSPKSIPNPNYGKRFKAGDIHSLKDCTSKRIPIPCGHCDECIALKQMYLVQRLQMEALSNYLFFATLTYNDESLPKVVTSTGYEIRYADISDMQNMFKRIRGSDSFGRPFKFLYVSELGSLRGRPHFHAVFIVPRYSDDDSYTPYNLEKTMHDVVFLEWRRNYGSRRKPVYKPLFTYCERWRSGVLHRNFDLHYIVPFSDSDCSSVAFYVLKYMLKPSDKVTRLQQALHLNLPSDEYEDIWKLVKPRCIASKGLGLNLDEDGNIDPLILAHLKDSISMSKDFPKFYNPKDGKSFPLSRYYRKRGDIYSFDDALRFYFDSNSTDLDSPIIPEHVRNITDINLAEYRFKKIRLMADDSGVMDNETFDYE